MKFNVNEYVRVKLTPTGKDILRKQFEERHERMPQVFKELSLPVEDEQGFSQWQMWRLFETFGNHVFLGCEPPFETEIEIFEKAFQQSVHPTPLTLFGMRVEIANWLKPGQWFIRPSRRG